MFLFWCSDQQVISLGVLPECPYALSSCMWLVDLQFLLVADLSGVYNKDACILNYSDIATFQRNITLIPIMVLITQCAISVSLFHLSASPNYLSNSTIASGSIMVAMNCLQIGLTICISFYLQYIGIYFTKTQPGKFFYQNP